MAEDLKPAVPDEDDRLTDAEREAVREFDEMMAAEEEAELHIEDPGEDPEAKTDDDAAAEAARAEEAARVPRTPEPEREPPMPEIDFSKKLTEARQAVLDARQKERDLKAEYDDGEIGQEEYQRRLAEIEGELVDAEGAYSSLRTLNEAQASTKEQRAAQERAQRDAQWKDVESRFVAANKVLVSPEHVEAFNKHVFAVTEDSAGLYEGLDYEDRLDIAMTNYLEALRRQGKETPEVTYFKAANDPDQPDEPATPDPKVAEREARAKEMRQPPVTLRDVPNDAADPHEDAARRIAKQIEMETNPEKVDRLWAQLAANPDLEARVLEFGSA